MIALMVVAMVLTVLAIIDKQRSLDASLDRAASKISEMQQNRVSTADMESIWAIESMRRASHECPERDELEEVLPR